MDSESRLRAEKIFRAVVESAPNAMVLADVEGRIVLINVQAERLFGYLREELIGQLVEMLIPVRYRGSHPGHRTAFLANPHARPMGAGRELFGLRKDGVEVPVEIGINPIQTEEGNFILAAVVDITERRRAEEEQQRMSDRLQQAQKMESLALLAGGIAHDFNNLLVAILGNAGLARRHMPPESPVMPMIKDIEASSERAAALINQMLAYSGRGKFQIEAVNLNRLVEEMTHLVSATISKKAVLKFNLEPNLPAILADVTQIRQVVMNLIINASEALADKSGVISVTTGVVDADAAYLQGTSFPDGLTESTYVFLEVSDTGCGMDEATQKKIFDPFFTTKFTGRGLGLAAVQGILRGHKGAVKVYSQLRKGTTFKVMFPPLTVIASENRGSGSADMEAFRGSGTILVMDDEESVCGVTKSILQSVGFTVLTAPDGRSGVEKYKERQGEIVCVLMDLTMPHMDGVAAFRALRQIRPDVRVILMSGYNEQDAINEFAGKGLASFLHKPFKVEALLKTVRTVLQAKT